MLFSYLLIFSVVFAQEAYVMMQDEVNKISSGFVEEKHLQNMEIKYMGGTIKPYTYTYQPDHKYKPTYYAVYKPHIYDLDVNYNKKRIEYKYYGWRTYAYVTKYNVRYEVPSNTYYKSLGHNLVQIQPI